MTITISSVSSQYRSYLQRADSNQNGEIDSDSEACSAAQSYCTDNPSHCENMLQFLSNTGQFTCSPTIPEPHEDNRSFRLSLSLGFSGGTGAFFL